MLFTQPAFKSVSSFSILFLNQFLLNVLSSVSTIVLPISSLTSPNFSQLYDFLLSTRFSSQLRVNCPCFLHPRRLSFVMSAVLSFTCLVRLFNSLLRRLAVCNTAELMLFWCVLTICISGTSLLSTYSTSFVYSARQCWYCQ